ncbi:hypothetical protein C8T65DRAFT_286055 [Cerioporus squamosus]|nr:hypothetical protein C8T65DRAFT_286055 [Cerioporus squamosus]
MSPRLLFLRCQSKGLPPTRKPSGSTGACQSSSGARGVNSSQLVPMVDWLEEPDRENHGIKLDVLCGPPLIQNESHARTGHSAASPGGLLAQRYHRGQNRGISDARGHRLGVAMDRL